MFSLNGTMTTKPLRTISIEEFARRLRVTSGAPDKRFAFFLGAGCSVSSGVPHAGSLVKEHWLPRLRDLRAPSRKDLDTWAREVFENYDPSNPAAAYGQVIDHLFLQPEERQREIESLCDGRFPGFGYAVLSGLVKVDAGKFNVVLTTNFDDLIADALYLFTTAGPLVIHHESLASYIRPTRTRPLIVKLHGDHRLSPQNTARETDTVKNEIEASVRTLLHDRGLVFMGYGGNDKGIHKMLQALPPEALPLGIFWIARSEPQGIFRPWLESRNAVWVQKGDFDECMLVLRDEFQIEHPERRRFDEVFEKYTETYKNLSARINALPDTSPEASVLKEVVKRTDQSFPDWRAVSLEAKRLQESDPDQAEAIFRKGVEQFPSSGRLLADYAQFVRRVRRMPETALQLLERSVAVEEANAWVQCDLATYLRWFCHDFKRAEVHYKRALEIEPENQAVLIYYAELLSEWRKDYDAAEILFERAAGMTPDNSFVLTHFGDFLWASRKDLSRAESLYRRAVAITPPDAFALTALANVLFKKNPGEAELYLRLAVEAAPQNTYALRCYADFLTEVRQDHDRAEELWTRAVTEDTFDPHLMVQCAGFMEKVRRDYDRAERLLGQALSMSPDDPAMIVPYADFLRRIRKDESRAGELERRLKEPLQISESMAPASD
jgi:tetratricopeptide (TPR) repeat protein